MERRRVRMLPLAAAGVVVDDAGVEKVLRGVSVAQAVEALGHGMALDGVTLRQIAALGNGAKKGVKCRFTHPGLSDDGLGKFLGRIRALRVEGDKVFGDLFLSPLAFRSPTDGNLGEYILARAQEDPESFGMSVVVDVADLVWVDSQGREYSTAGEKPVDAINDVPHLRVANLVACDVVDEPAANRDGVFAAAWLWGTNEEAAEVFGLIDGEMARLGVSPERAYRFAMRYFAARGVDVSQQEREAMDVDVMDGMVEEMAAVDGMDTVAVADAGNGVEASPAMVQEAGNLRALQREMEASLAKLRVREVEQAIGGSGLSGESQGAVRAALAGRMEQAADEEVEALIAAQRAVEASLRAALAEQTAGVRGVGPDGQVRGMLSSMDKLKAAVEALLSGVRPEDGVKPLSGIRELYITLTGDYEFAGIFQPERVAFANVNSATMAGLVADALNKRVINQFQTYPRFWEPLVHVEDFTTLQAVKWITLGGVGELSTVPEGGAYTEKTWDDQTEVADWTKTGNYLGLTLEAIDKDDTRRIQQAPRALAQAAWMTLGKAFTRLFTAPPTMSDGKALFHADHGNLGSAALGYSAYEATRTAMAQQTELNSGEPLGGLTVPRYLMVPRQLEGAALQMLASEGEPDVATNNENVWAQGNTHDARMAAARRRVIVNDFLSDGNDWYALADPMLYPSIGLGFRFGRAPEIIALPVTSTREVGLMFTNDVMPIKVRWFFAIGPTDWRGMYKQAVG